MDSLLFKRYKIYEFIRDNENITEEISNTKRILINLEKENEKTIEFCNKKVIEEKREIEEAKEGKHFHENMTKREILVNEISQYIYWLTIIEISKRLRYKDSKIEKEINKILEKIEIKNIGETDSITIDEIVKHDLEDMKTKRYLKEVIEI